MTALELLVVVLVLGVFVTGVAIGPKNIACWLGFHGKSLERLHGNRYHTDYRCKYCERDVMRWEP